MTDGNYLKVVRELPVDRSVAASSMAFGDLKIAGNLLLGTSKSDRGRELFMTIPTTPSSICRGPTTMRVGSTSQSRA
jgi:hypothetical protein